MLTDPTTGDVVALIPAIHIMVPLSSILSVAVISIVELSVGPKLALIMVRVNGGQLGADDPSWGTIQVSEASGSSQRVTPPAVIL